MAIQNKPSHSANLEGFRKLVGIDSEILGLSSIHPQLRKIKQMSIEKRPN